MKKYDLIIIGAGPAGLSAAIYAARYNMKTLVIGVMQGGTAVMAHRVQNYPGFMDIPGYELMQKMIEQVRLLDVQIYGTEVKSVSRKGKGFTVISDKEYYSRNIIFASGTEKIKLGARGEAQFMGKGVSYCATCDGFLFKGKSVAVIGGNNSALTSALLLAENASKVYLIHRGKDFSKAEQYWQKKVKAEKKIKIILGEEVMEIFGKESVEGVLLKSKRKISLEGVFIQVGSTPNSKLAKMIDIQTNYEGYIKTDISQRTNVKGAYAAGDVTNGLLKQIVTAVGQGAKAAYSAYSDSMGGVEDEY